MKIAITTWGNRVSPVFDAAGTLLIARIDNHAVTDKTYQPFHPDDIEELTALLKREQVSTLICGAISTEPAAGIAKKDIHLIPFVSGTTMEVVNSFASLNAIDPSFMMPGFSSGRTKHIVF